jgi:hypothetical protein
MNCGNWWWQNHKGKGQEEEKYGQVVREKLVTFNMAFQHSLQRDVKKFVIIYSQAQFETDICWTRQNCYGCEKSIGRQKKLYFIRILFLLKFLYWPLRLLRTEKTFHIANPQRKLAQVLTLLTCMREVVGSNFGRYTHYSKGFRGLPQSLSENSRIILKLGDERFLPDPFQFTVHDHPVIRRYTVWVNWQRRTNRQVQRAAPLAREQGTSVYTQWGKAGQCLYHLTGTV